MAAEKSKAQKFREEHGYSLTMSKLMQKWNCKTVAEYREVRKKHRKEGYVGPRKEKKKTETPVESTYRGGNRNDRGYNRGYRR